MNREALEDDSPMDAAARVSILATVEHHDACAAGGLDERAQMRQQIHGFGDLLDLGPQLASIAEQVIIGIDEQQSGPIRGIIV
jgi:hypothetical protein